MLVERHNFLFVGASEMLVEELKKRGLALGREQKAQLSAEWRRESGMAAIVARAYDQYKAQQSKYSGLIVGSLRHPGEGDLIHELGGKMLWVDADPVVRYKRISANAHARGRVAEDDKTYEEFLADEEREMHPTGDAATLNGAAVKAQADLVLINNGDDIEVFKDNAEAALADWLR